MPRHHPIFVDNPYSMKDKYVYEMAWAILAFDQKSGRRNSWILDASNVFKRWFRQNSGPKMFRIRPISGQNSRLNTLDALSIRKVRRGRFLIARNSGHWANSTLYNLIDCSSARYAHFDNENLRAEGPWGFAGGHVIWMIGLSSHSSPYWHPYQLNADYVGELLAVAIAGAVICIRANIDCCQYICSNAIVAII